MKFWKSISSDKNRYNSIDKKIVKEYNKNRNLKSRKYLCYAPFKSLTFFLAGDVMACWHNKQYLLGHYPEDSISDIWFGEKLKKLREHIINNDLTYGCEECEKHIKSSDFYSAGAWRYDYLSLKKSDYPISLDFQISNICNLECIMCNGEYSISVRQYREMKLPYLNPYDSNFVKQLEPFIPHLYEASFSGGEVFLIEQYYNIWEKIYKINPKVLISITTNGSILNDRIKNIMKKLRFNITLSLDSVNKENYEKIRINARFEDMLNHLNYYIDYCKKENTNLSVRICPLRQNWHELPDIFRYLNDKHVNLYFNKVIFPPYCSLWNLSSEKLLEIFNYLSDFSFVTVSQNQKNNYKNYLNLIEQLKIWQKEAINRDKKYPHISTFNTDKLMELLILQVKNYMNTTASFEQSEKDRFILFFENVIQSCIKEITDKELLNNALKYYIVLPVNRLIDEFNIRNAEKIISFTKQAGRTL